MATPEFRFDPGANILQPALPDPRNLLAPAKFGSSLNITKGQAVATKTSDHKMYPYNPGASDGTQTFAGFAQFSFSTDANGLVYMLVGGASAAPTFFSPPQDYANIYTSGVFDPGDLATQPGSGTPTAEVDTITPTSPTTGDIYTVEAPNGVQASFTVGGTQTAAAVVTGLTAAWNSDPYLKSIGTPSGSSTFIVTAVTPGVAMNLKATAVGTGTVALVQTTAPVAAVQAEVDTWTFGGSIATGDVYTVTATYGGGQTRSVSFTVGATTTASAVDAGLIAAWNADPYLSQLATASGTTTFVLTGVVAGNTLNIAAATTGSGTVSKVITKAAYGQSITDIQISRAGAYVMQPYGFFVIP